jgi:hypothetical protein
MGEDAVSECAVQFVQIIAHGGAAKPIPDSTLCQVVSTLQAEVELNPSGQTRPNLAIQHLLHDPRMKAAPCVARALAKKGLA